MKKTLFILIFLPLSFYLKAQSVEFGLLAGVSIYNGDLSPALENFTQYFDDLQPAGGIFLRGVLHPKFAIRGSLSLGSLTADDEGRVNNNRGLDFTSPLVELAVVGEFHLFRNARWTNPHLSPYAFVGGAGYFFNPKTEFEGETIELQPLGTEGQGLANFPDQYSRVQFAIPMGIGIHLQVNDRFSIAGEFGGRKLFTDYIDDVGSQPVNFGILVSGNGQVAGELSIRNEADRPTEPTNDTYTRGSDLVDWYYIGGITVAFKIQGTGGNQFGCPGF